MHRFISASSVVGICVLFIMFHNCGRNTLEIWLSLHHPSIPLSLTDQVITKNDYSLQFTNGTTPLDVPFSLTFSSQKSYCYLPKTQSCSQQQNYILQQLSDSSKQSQFQSVKSNQSLQVNSALLCCRKGAESNHRTPLENIPSAGIPLHPISCMGWSGKALAMAVLYSCTSLQEPLLEVQVKAVLTASLDHQGPNWSQQSLNKGRHKLPPLCLCSNTSTSTGMNWAYYVFQALDK